MEVDAPQAPNGHSSELRVNGLLLHPVLPQDEGEGLPYAPIDWPNPGDTWGWRVGKRTTISGYYLDRYLYLPSRLQKSRRGRDGFASKLSVEQYIQARFPGTDIEAFFASFSWKVPSKQTFLIKEHHGSSCMLSEELAEASLSDCHTARPSCKAGNSSCPSLTEEEKVSSVTSTMICDICCSEPSFCRECCCILCCKTIDFAFGGYSFMRCQSKVHDGLICAHAAHLTCALRSYLAGAVPGSIALDAQYYCRRCDSRTELVEHVTKVFKICESVDSPEDIKKMLNLVICLLRGSQRRDVKRLLNRAQLVLQKFESGDVSDVWIWEDDISGVRKDMVSPQTVSELPHQNPSPAAQEKPSVPPPKAKGIVISEPSTEAHAKTRMQKRQDLAPSEKVAKKQKVAEAPSAPTSARTKAYSSRGPSSPDMKKLAIPDDACHEEKRWLASLPSDALHHETMKFLEMARLGLSAISVYCGALEKKCQSLEEAPPTKSQLAIAQELVISVQQERDRLQKEKDTLAKELKSKADEVAAKDKSLNSKNRDLSKAHDLIKKMKEKIETMKGEAEAYKKREEKLKQRKKELEAQIVAGKEALQSIYNSEEFKVQLGASIYPHWQQGLRIGVRQAVKAYGDIDPKIIYFEPDYEDFCDEPEIEDSEDEAESTKRDEGGQEKVEEEDEGKVDEGKEKDETDVDKS